MNVRVALVGCGRWGSRLLAALLRHPDIDVVAIVDTDRRALASAARLAPQVDLAATLHPTLDVQAAVIATPALLHAAHARRALSLGLDVLVEKPLATCSDDALALASMAHRLERVAMVGHVLRYHPLVERMIALVKSDAVGPLQRVHFRRFTASRTKPELWALAPHDIGTLHAIDSSAVARLAAISRGGIIEIDLALTSGLHASLEISTTARDIAREACLIGRRGRIVLDELSARLSVITANQAPRVLSVRQRDAVQLELDHFVRCVRERRSPRTSFDECIRVVQTLERAHTALQARDRIFAAAR